MVSAPAHAPGTSRLRWLSAVSVLALAVACGGKDKKAAETPGTGGGSGSGVATGDPANTDPDNGFGDPGTGDPGTDPGDPGTGDPGTDPGTGDPGTGPDGKPEIKPPGLDLSPAQKAARVKGHLDAGQAALRGSSPDPDKTIDEAKKALAVDETSVNAMILLAYGNVKKKYYDQALDVLRKAVERGGRTNRMVHFLFGLVYDNTDRPDDAFKSYQQAVSLSPSYKSALMNVGVHYLRNRRYAEAASTYERLTGSLNYTTAAAWTNLGSAYRGQSAGAGLPEPTRNALIIKAETTYKRAISANKNYGNAYYNLGLLYLDSDPFPQGGGEMDRLARLKRSKTYFDEYRRLPGANTKKVDEVAATAAKLIGKEERIRKKAADRAKRDKEREAAGGN